MNICINELDKSELNEFSALVKKLTGGNLTVSEFERLELLKSILAYRFLGIYEGAIDRGEHEKA